MTLQQLHRSHLSCSERSKRNSEKKRLGLKRVFTANNKRFESVER